MLSNQQQWDRLGWPLDRKAFAAHLNGLREIRNMVDLLRQYGR
ncbi:hypothetical protein [Streptomyces sp. NBC_01276]